MKDHEIAQFINDLTKLMQETPDAQKRAVLSAKLVPIIHENAELKELVDFWEHGAQERRKLHSANTEDAHEGVDAL